MNTNKPDEKTSTQEQVRSIAVQQDTERCRGCPYPSVGFICWNTDGSCMKTEVEKINSKRRR